MRGLQRVEIRRRKLPERVDVRGDVALIDAEKPLLVRPKAVTSRPVLTLPTARPVHGNPVSKKPVVPMEKRVDPLVSKGVDEVLVRRHREMEASYGFGLPVPLPRFAPSSTQSGDLVIREVEESPKGYVGPSALPRVAMVLAEEAGDIASTRLFDLESIAWHVDQAKGNVVVAGLGMGVLLHALCLKPTVDRVIVIEPDVTAFQLFRISAMPFTWPGFDTKVQVIVGDPFEPAAKAVVRAEWFGKRPDYLIASLWPEIPDREAIDDMKRLVRQFDPVAAGWWGQELELAIWLESRQMRMDEHSVGRFFRESGIPCRPSPGYVEFCIDVAKNAGYDVAPEG